MDLAKYQLLLFPSGFLHQPVLFANVGIGLCDSFWSRQIPRFLHGFERHCFRDLDPIRIRIRQ